MAEKKRNKKQIRLQDIKKNLQGHYDYMGPVYVFGGESADYKQFRLRAWTLSLICALCAIAGGIVPATGAMDTWYVILPYGATVLSAGLVIYRVVQWTQNNGVLREYTYEKAGKGFPINIKGLMASATITLVMEIYHLARYGMGEYPIGALILVISMALTIVFGRMLDIEVSRQSWTRFNQ